MSHPRDNGVLDVLAAVIHSLKGTRAPYMMIGAWALALWGRPRATMDLDFKYLEQWSERLGLAAELDYLLGE